VRLSSLGPPALRLPAAAISTWPDEALATVIAARSVRPPLSIGLFADWGTGKSFFLGALDARVGELAETGGSSFCGGVRSVWFNAWHYSDAELWPSLAAHIFEQFADDPTTEARVAQVSALATDMALHAAQRERANLRKQRAMLDSKPWRAFVDANAGQVWTLAASLGILGGERFQRRGRATRYAVALLLVPASALRASWRWLLASLAIAGIAAWADHRYGWNRQTWQLVGVVMPFILGLLGHFGSAIAAASRLLPALDRAYTERERQREKLDDEEQRLDRRIGELTERRERYEGSEVLLDYVKARHSRCG
jgi:KAP family P-loop domain